jgi:hypothetical protein
MKACYNYIIKFNLALQQLENNTAIERGIVMGTSENAQATADWLKR